MIYEHQNKVLIGYCHQLLLYDNLRVNRNILVSLKYNFDNQ